MTKQVAKETTEMLKYLATADVRLAAMINSVGAYEIKPRNDPFQPLMEAIIYQQLAGRRELAPVRQDSWQVSPPSAAAGNHGFQTARSWPFCKKDRVSQGPRLALVRRPAKACQDERIA